VLAEGLLASSLDKQGWRDSIDTEQLTIALGADTGRLHLREINHTDIVPAIAMLPFNQAVTSTASSKKNA
jgi:hypothetical protein